MDAIRIRPAEPPGLAATLRAGLSAGCVVGPLFGLADGIVAANLDAVRGSWLAVAGCLAAAVFEYTLVAMAALTVLGGIVHPLVRKLGGARRQVVLLRAGIALGLFAEIYWWTRPYVFYGHAATSPGRLLSTIGMLAVAIFAGMIAGSLIVRAPAGAKRAFALFAAASWLVGVVFLLVQRNAIGDRGKINERNRDVPNVVLVIVDAMRRDVLGCYGNSRVKTPNIDKLAKEGVVFENAFTQVPWTLPSFGSILTGKYPRRHGLWRMRAGVSLPTGNRTLAMILKDADRSDGTRIEDKDWLAATFHTGTLTAESRLLGGFDMRYEATAGHDLVVLESTWSTFRSGLLLAILPNKIRQHLDLGGTAEEACAWIGDRGDRRFFAMVHLYSTHTPYDPPAKFRSAYCDPRYGGKIQKFDADIRRVIESGSYQPTLADASQIRNLYYGGVSEADARIGSLVDALERRGVLDDTLVIVTADHGESLGEQGFWEHGHMVQTNLRIPLVMRLPKKIHGGSRVPAIVDEIDILPTIFDLLDLRRDPPEAIDGRSAVPLIRGDADWIRDYSFAENELRTSVQDLRWKLVVARKILAAGTKFEDAAKLGTERPRLFDVREDPDEKFDQFEKAPEEAERLYKVLRDWSDKLPIPPDAAPLSPREQENLQHIFNSLGYPGDPDDEPKR
jgi:arylsulfatase A-like enzyme